MLIISIPFATSKSGKISEEEYLPGLLLEVNKSKKGGGLLKKSGETMDGIAELTIPLLISFYERRERGILFLHSMLTHEKTLYFPEVVLHDPDLLEERFGQAETDYDEYVSEFSELLSSITKIRKNGLEFSSIPGKEVLDDLKMFLSFSYEKEDTGSFIFDTDDFDENQEVQEVHKVLDCEEDKISGLSSNLENIQEVVAEKTEILKRNSEEECKQTIAERNTKRRETIDAFNIKAAEIKALKRDNDCDEERLLSVRVGRKETIEFKYNQEKDASSKASGEERERLKSTVSEYRNQSTELDGEIREIKAKAENRRNELHNQLLALDAKLENFDNETTSIRYGCREKLDKLDHLSERLQDYGESYVINAKNELTDRINDLSINLPLPNVSEDTHNSFFVYIPVYIAVFKDDRAGTERFVIFPPKYVEEGMVSVASSLLTRFKKIEHQEGLRSLIIDHITKVLMDDKDLEIKVLEHIFKNSILKSSSDKHDTIAKGAEKLKSKEKVSEKDYNIIKSMLEWEEE
ncbi:MAG: hypothetical protein U9Q68_11335 [Euryarchaeota archaeon]|nr:hypothetical protein [Euryarchaeota archaeon]